MYIIRFIIAALQLKIIVKEIKPRKMRVARHDVVIRSAYKIVVGKPESKVPGLEGSVRSGGLLLLTL